jgi:hypothetical protein
MVMSSDDVLVGQYHAVAMKHALLAALVLVVAGCSSYEATIDVQIVGAESVAQVHSGVYAADDAALTTAPRLPYREATVETRFLYPPGVAERRTWRVKLTYTKDQKLRWHGEQDVVYPPQAVLITISAPDRPPVQGSFACGKEGIDLDLVGVLSRAP